VFVLVWEFSPEDDVSESAEWSIAMRLGEEVRLHIFCLTVLLFDDASILEILEAEESFLDVFGSHEISVRVKLYC
jgi:hypothetical protein